MVLLKHITLDFANICNFYMSVVSNIFFFKIELYFSKFDLSDRKYLYCVEELEDKGITVSKTEKERTEK